MSDSVCALQPDSTLKWPDGTLKDASEIELFNDLDDNVPIMVVSSTPASHLLTLSFSHGKLDTFVRRTAPTTIEQGLDFVAGPWGQLRRFKRCLPLNQSQQNVQQWLSPPQPQSRGGFSWLILLIPVTLIERMTMTKICLNFRKPLMMRMMRWRRLIRERRPWEMQIVM